MGSPRFASVAFGRETCDSGDLARHRHDCGYLTVVLRGGYEEAGDAGRFRVREGDVLIHQPFEAHHDFFAGRDADVLNLPLPDTFLGAGMVRISDPDAVARAAEVDLAAAAAVVVATAAPAAEHGDWPDLLAAELRKPNAMGIGQWARLNGLAPATVSRGFFQAFGTTAARYRAEARARLAWSAVRTTRQSFAELACDFGFADQAHMTRSVTELTGLSPGRWRGRGQMSSRPA